MCLFEALINCLFWIFSTLICKPSVSNNFSKNTSALMSLVCLFSFFSDSRTGCLDWLLIIFFGIWLDESVELDITFWTRSDPDLFFLPDIFPLTSEFLTSSTSKLFSRTGIRLLKFIQLKPWLKFQILYKSKFSKLRSLLYESSMTTKSDLVPTEALQWAFTRKSQIYLTICNQKLVLYYI